MELHIHARMHILVRVVKPSMSVTDWSGQWGAHVACMAPPTPTLIELFVNQII